MKSVTWGRVLMKSVTWGRVPMKLATWGRVPIKSAQKTITTKANGTFDTLMSVNFQHIVPPDFVKTNLHCPKLTSMAARKQSHHLEWSTLDGTITSNGAFDII